MSGEAEATCLVRGGYMSGEGICLVMFCSEIWLVIFIRISPHPAPSPTSAFLFLLAHSFFSLVPFHYCCCFLLIMKPNRHRYYFYAQQLAPKDGRPYNQLAVIAISAVRHVCVCVWRRLGWEEMGVMEEKDA